MPYPEEWVRPAREELNQLGIQELRNAKEVDEVLGKNQGTVMVVVNSICGCAAGRARPAIAQVLQDTLKPDLVTSVFAGQDMEATARAREYFQPYPPSSPSVPCFAMELSFSCCSATRSKARRRGISQPTCGRLFKNTVSLR